MSYVVTTPVEFAYPRHRVYEALCDLSRYPEWNTGMTHISQTGPMRTGLKYVTTTNVLGRVNRATVVVVQLVPHEAIVLASVAGLITFQAEFRLASLTPDSCSVTCSLKFKFSNAIFNLAYPVIEVVTEARIRGDLEALRTLMSGA